MASWIVMEEPNGRIDERDVVFLRDGFAWLAFLVPPLWLLAHRLWLAGTVVLALLLGAALLERTATYALVAPLVSLMVSLFAGLEGNAMRIAAYRRRGWLERAVIEADDLHDAETRYAADADEDGDGIPDRFQIRPAPGPVALPAGPVGLLLNPGR